jgi:hypothetical protein
MKKLVLLLTIITLSYSCSSDSNSNSNNPSNGNVNYYFKIKINGVEHKVQGNTSDDNNQNGCSASVGSTTVLGFSINDITSPNYISGQYLSIGVTITNCHVGLNQANIYISSPVKDAFYQPLAPTSDIVENSGLYCLTVSSLPYPLFSTYANKITINITDMGTPNGPQGFGNTFKGSYNGPIYFGNMTLMNNLNVFNMNIPMQFSMEFEAYRVN